MKRCICKQCVYIFLCGSHSYVVWGDVLVELVRLVDLLRHREREGFSTVSESYPCAVDSG